MSLFLKRVMRRLGVYFRHLSPQEQHYLRSHPNRELREFFIEQALLGPLSLGQISATEANFLNRLVREQAGDGPIIEIGTLFGFSTRVISSAKPAHQKFLTVDNFCWNTFGLVPDLHYSITRRLLANATSHLNVELVREDKDRFYEQYAGPAPSLVFLDADHGYEATRADIAWALRAGARCICGHDYDADKFPGVVQAVEELGGCAKRVETLWLLRGRAEA